MIMRPFCQFLTRLWSYYAGTPEQKGVAERTNRTLIDIVRNMMITCSLLDSVWGEALETSAYILNTVPRKYVPKCLFRNESSSTKFKPFSYLRLSSEAKIYKTCN